VTKKTLAATGDLRTAIDVSVRSLVDQRNRENRLLTDRS
jgi:hypothetical protein